VRQEQAGVARVALEADARGAPRGGADAARGARPRAQRARAGRGGSGAPAAPGEAGAEARGEEKTAARQAAQNQGRLNVVVCPPISMKHTKNRRTLYYTRFCFLLI